MDGNIDRKVLADLYEDAIMYLRDTKIYDDIDPADQEIQDWNQNLVLYYCEAQAKGSKTPIADAVRLFASDIGRALEERGMMVRYEEDRLPLEDMVSQSE